MIEFQKGSQTRVQGRSANLDDWCPVHVRSTENEASFKGNRDRLEKVDRREEGNGSYLSTCSTAVL